MADLMRCGYQPREALRLACELTQDEVAARFNQIRDDPDSRMRGSRICEYEKWPKSRARPSVWVLKILATIYETTWDRLIDIDDLEKMSVSDRRAFLDISNLRYGDSLDLPAPRRSRHPRNAPHGGDDSPMNWPVTAEEPVAVDERLLVASPVLSLERPGGGLPGEVTHFTGRDGPMAELRDRIAEQGPQGTVVPIR